MKVKNLILGQNNYSVILLHIVIINLYVYDIHRNYENLNKTIIFGNIKNGQTT